MSQAGVILTIVRFPPNYAVTCRFKNVIAVLEWRLVLRLQLKVPRSRLGSRCRSASDRIIADKSKSAFSDGQMNLVKIVTPQVGLVVGYSGIIGCFLGGGDTCRAASLPAKFSVNSHFAKESQATQVWRARLCRGSVEDVKLQTVAESNRSPRHQPLRLELSQAQLILHQLYRPKHSRRKCSFRTDTLTTYIPRQTTEGV